MESHGEGAAEGLCGREGALGGREGGAGCGWLVCVRAARAKLLLCEAEAWGVTYHFLRRAAAPLQSAPRLEHSSRPCSTTSMCPGRRLRENCSAPSPFSTNVSDPVPLRGPWLMRCSGIRCGCPHAHICREATRRPGTYGEAAALCASSSAP